jgi:hypothetical protein
MRVIRDVVAGPKLPLGTGRHDFMGTVHDRLKTSQITLPDIPPSVADAYMAAFVPFVRTGNLIYFSGRLAKKDGQLWVGKLGEEITVAEGKQAPWRDHDRFLWNQPVPASKGPRRLEGLSDRGYEPH